jgi:hypothetical protein
MTESVFILSKVQRAFREFLRNHDARPAWMLESSVVSGISRGAQADPDTAYDQDRSVPCPRVVIECSRATHTANYSSQYRATVRVLVEDVADRTSEEDHLGHCGDVFNMIVVPGVAEALTGAVNDFHAFLVVPGEQSYQLDGRLWVGSMTFEVECLGHAFS